MARRRDTMLVCQTDPECACSGTEFDCQCVKVTGGPACDDCRAPLIRINVDSGERVA